MEQHLEEFELVLLRRNFRPNSIRAYLRAALRFLAEADAPLSEITRKHITDYLVDDDSCDEMTWPELRPVLDRLYKKSWVVYAKKPFGSAEHVFRYLGRYTHRIAISNHRILKLDDDAVTFATRHGQKTTLPARVFLKRFLQHVVPQRYVRIRHYGVCAPANVHSRLEQARQLLQQDQGLTPRRLRETPEEDFRALLNEVTGVDLRLCPACSCAGVQRTALPQSRAPPA